jgi:hypothetical protein
MKVRTARGSMIKTAAHVALYRKVSRSRSRKISRSRNARFARSLLWPF